MEQLRYSACSSAEHRSAGFALVSRVAFCDGGRRRRESVGAGLGGACIVFPFQRARAVRVVEQGGDGRLVVAAERLELRLGRGCRARAFSCGFGVKLEEEARERFESQR